jgi:membrane-associated protease RseP (regulator of RpoE activity)
MPSKSCFSDQPVNTMDESRNSPTTPTQWHDPLPYPPEPRVSRKRRFGSGTAVHVALFALTVASTFLVGLGDGIAGAFWYSGGIMAILLAHEMGHYLMARKYGIPATLPFFIPMPFSPFGTMGAVIKMSGTIPDRRALMDVGAAGPLAGMVFIVPSIVIGLMKSKMVPLASLADHSISLGDSLLFTLLSRISIGPVPEGHDILLHPLAFAGWVGLLVTALNLLPIGQLDGGHISYSLFRGKSTIVSRLFYWILIGVCLFLYAGWALLVVVLTIIRRHPPTWDDSLPLDRRRVITGWIALAVFLLAFTPVPFGIGEGIIPWMIKALR